MMDDARKIMAYAQGQRTDYALERAPIAEGGQAYVFRALHKPSRITVAFKRLRHTSEEAVARMIREIEVGKVLNHPHVMPVLDNAADCTWFVMPLAVADLENRRTELAADETALRTVIKQICAALSAAHEKNYVHRDIKPSNVLLKSEAPATWVLADWGLVRRPPGQTTDPARTRVGTSYGTAGFAAPELSVNAHTVGPPADVYGLGQLLGWILTGQWPQQNVPLLPTEGAWRTIVREATRRESSRRPQSASAFAQLIEEELQPPPALPSEVGEYLIGRMKNGDDSAPSLLFALADRYPEDYDLYVDVLPKMSVTHRAAAVGDDPSRAGRLVEAMSKHLGGDWGDRPFRWADEVILWLYGVAHAAERLRHWELLDIAADTLFEWDAYWDQWPPQRTIRLWLSTLRGEAARIVSRALRRHPQSKQHFQEVANDTRTDGAIRLALQ